MPIVAFPVHKFGNRYAIVSRLTNEIIRLGNGASSTCDGPKVDDGSAIFRNGNEERRRYTNRSDWNGRTDGIGSMERTTVLEDYSR